jgi:lipopolysaccharide biosynthesis glycosyltransferase
MSFDAIAKNIYKSTGILNITKLNIYLNNKDIDTSNFNHIHLGMGFDKNYIFLVAISMANILNTSNPDTYIHFHLVLINNIQYKDLKPIINLNKINKNVEFIFYNGKQVEYDFGKRAKKEKRGIGDYTRLLLPEIVNNTNKIIIMDCADIIVKKDLSELFFFDIGDNYFVFSLEYNAGRFLIRGIFGRNNFYPNSGICLINIRKFREDNLYKNAFFSSIAYKFLPCPYQDILLMISNYKFKYWPLNYNCPQFFTDNEKHIKNNNSKKIKYWLSFQKYSPFRYSKEELVEASKNPVIIHLYLNKPFLNLANSENTLAWINYSKMAGVYLDVKKNFPKILKRFNLE